MVQEQGFSVVLPEPPDDDLWSLPGKLYLGGEVVEGGAIDGGPDRPGHHDILGQLVVVHCHPARRSVLLHRHFYSEVMQFGFDLGHEVLLLVLGHLLAQEGVVQAGQFDGLALDLCVLGQGLVFL